MNYYNEIKNELINNEVHKKVKDYSKNKYELQSYYNVGRLIVEAQGGEHRAKYGNGLIKEYSNKLTQELGKGYSSRSLKYMRKFYLLKKGQPLVAELSWSHYIVLMSIKETEKIRYYEDQILIYNLSKRELREKIKNKEYERLDEKTKLMLKEEKDSKEVTDFLKNPLVIKNKYNYEEISEKALKELICDDIPSFMKELGEGFSFIDIEYKIKIGNNYNYIDMLLFNYKYNCYVVVELKVTELKKEHIGQIETYMNYIDKNVRSISQDKTIGIIIVKKENKFILEYCSDKRIFETEYTLI